MKYRIKISKATGAMSWLTAPPFQMPVHSVRRERFSEIVPLNMPLRIAFRILRCVFGEDGVCAVWTRQWRCLWRMEILIGRHAGTVRIGSERSLLIEIEHEIWFAGIDAIL